MTMAEYRTVTVEASVSPNICVTATLSGMPGAITAEAKVSRNITAAATVSKSVVGAIASIAEMTVNAAAEITTQVIGGDVPMYRGPYVVTPSEEAQTLPTKTKACAENIIINPIPSNYGRITWDGSTLTVS